MDPEWADSAAKIKHRPRRQAIDATLALRTAVDSAIEAVRGITACMDSGTDSAPQRFTTRAIGNLRKLRDAILRGHEENNVLRSAMPMIRAGVPEGLREHARYAMEHMEEVKTAILAGVQPRVPPVSVSSELVARLETLAAAVDPHALPASVALTADHECILAELNKSPTKCKAVLDVSSASTICNRETVGRLLGELAGFGMVERPHGKHKGYALTDAGRKAVAPRSSDTTPALMPT